MMDGSSSCTEKTLIDDSYYHNLVKLYEPLLREYLIPKQIVFELRPFIGNEGIEKVRRSEEDLPADGVSKLIELLMASKEPGWFEAFIEALKAKDFDMVADHLCGKRDMKNSNIFKELLGVFCHQLVENVDPTDLTLYLLERNTITKEDFEEISTKNRRSGMFLLLMRLPLHTNYWFPDFIAALNNGDTKAYKILASDIEPAIAKACPEHQTHLVADDVQKLNEEPRTYIKTGANQSKRLCLSHSEEAMDMVESTSTLHIEYGEMETDNTHSEAGNSSHDATKKKVKEGTHDSEDHMKSNEGEQSESDINFKPLKLRSYQRELAEPAIDGKNVIIVAPTGSGKTHVALYITEKHFLDSADQNKMAFLVPTTELVSQQTRMYRTYLSRFKICGLSSEIQVSQKVPMSSLIEKYDIIVMTPQILLNALNKHHVESLKVFTLMVFDECHHATKEHPYNNIMAIYLDEKYLEDRDYLLPQIIGLTASVGVGNARDVLGAKKHILSLCANLDAVDGISIVENHKEELEKFVNKPNETKIETHGRKEDPFRNIISAVMKNIEQHIRNHIDKQKIHKLSQLMDVPSTQGSDPYTQWISRLHREVAMIYEQSIRRPMYACQAHLKIYNTALMINDDCRTADALAYLLKEFKEIDREHKDDTDEWLEALFNARREELIEISNNPRYDNPKLKKLNEVILNKYKNNPDMRAIIFCKTREMTMALKNSIEESSELAGLSPYHLVGANASAERGGMTQRKQEDVLTYFKNGKHKVIIATSVAEEGLDVSKCNLVIRYDYVTNEIAMVQARGRGRAEDSDYVLIGDHSRGASQKEETNKIKEEMMNRAIEKVKRMMDEECKREVLSLQNEMRTRRKMNEVGRMCAAASHSHGSPDDWELRCMKCDQIGCFASDIRVFESHHHMVMDRSFTDRVVIEPHPNPKNVDELVMTDKIFCKRCHHDWGIRATYNMLKVCVIKISSFRVIHIVNRMIRTPRKWRDAPFVPLPLTPDQLEQYNKSCF